MCIMYVCMYITKPTRTEGEGHGQVLHNAQTKVKHVIAITKPTAKLMRVTALTEPTRTQRERRGQLLHNAQTSKNHARVPGEGPSAGAVKWFCMQ